eukprot:TRINITY_DN47838_c0_g1_i1.p3 TRINITY_DN47838_c0_g1~~TRINITY_DN47838_c0_g1_i1.p3  ORF type:complete len:205 (+),score=44.93 TRINITY_DN47838_c0_g1_i1:63-617(+)
MAAAALRRRCSSAAPLRHEGFPQAAQLRDAVLEWCSRRADLALPAVAILQEMIWAYRTQRPPFEAALDGIDWCRAGYDQLLSSAAAAPPPSPRREKEPQRRQHSRCGPWYDFATLLWGFQTSKSVVRVTASPGRVLTVWERVLGSLDVGRERRVAARVLALWWRRRFGPHTHAALLRDCLRFLL